MAQKQAGGLAEQFLAGLDRKDKEACLSLAVGALQAGNLDVVSLYEGILAPALNTPPHGQGREPLAIWQEHARTSIVRTVVENCYPFVARERKSKYGKAAGSRRPVVVVCPTEEFHEIGARMVADFFELLDFDVTFIGANTPQEEILGAIAHVRPAFVAVSVSNVYNLVPAKRAVGRLREQRNREGLDFKIVVGGGAFKENAGLREAMGADLQLATFEEIRALAEGRVKG